MTITPDGILAAAVREKEAHPVLPNGKPVTAWDRRAQTITKTVERVNTHDLKLAELDAKVGEIQGALEDVLSRPF